VGLSSPTRPFSSESSFVIPTPKSSLLSSPQPTRRSPEERRPPTCPQGHECGQVIIAFFASKPQIFQEAAKDERWIDAMNENFRMIEKHNN